MKLKEAFSKKRRGAICFGVSRRIRIWAHLDTAAGARARVTSSVRGRRLMVMPLATEVRMVHALDGDELGLVARRPDPIVRAPIHRGGSDITGHYKMELPELPQRH